MKRHFNIPIFIPELACPHQCIFCNQERISNQSYIPKPESLETIIESYLATIPLEGAHVQIAFFGGSFTALPMDMQAQYLEAVQKYLSKGVAGLRISTRPDYISEKNLKMLQDFHVQNIELGAQSMNDEVLHLSARGHKADQTRQASHMILDHGFTLGLQMMIGLPGDNPIRSMETAHEIVELGAKETRIYPTLVLKDTPLEKLWKARRYKPLTISEAVAQAASLYHFFRSAGLQVLRTGLYPSEDFINGDGFLAGPFHSQFKELVLSEIWLNIINGLNLNSGKYMFKVAPGNSNHVYGFGGKNRLLLNQQGIYYKVKTSEEQSEFEIDVYPA
jgi:histone acetyltransferase (RNA polymerase elongator complex component)